MSDPSKAVFLSYASQDAEAARRIAEALRAAGVEVWFDQSELVGGDAWDAKIRGQIGSCALFLPMISANTQARLEGYFRREWKQAAARTHDMADEKTFLLPVVIDGTRDADAKVPAEFKAVQWTRLPGGETPEKFCKRVQRLLSGEPFDVAQGGQATDRPRPVERAADGPPVRKASRPWLVLVGLGLLAVVAVAIWRPWGNSPPTATARPSGSNTPPMTETQRLMRQARALIDDDPLVVRESYKSAVELCERATQLSPDDGEAWATLARANLRLATEYREDTEKRRIALRGQTERAIRLAPDSIEAGLAMAGYELSFEDNVAAARARLLRLVDRAPADRRLLRMLVSLEEDRGQDVQEARRWTERANALPGGDAGTLLSLAWVYWGRNDFPQVREAVEKSLAIRPMTESCQLRLMLFNQSGDFEGARRFLRDLPAAILREDRTALIGYEVQLYSGDYEGALRAITAVPREILEEGLFFSARGYLAGNALLLAGKTNAAKVEFGVALKALDERLAETPRDSRVVYHRAMVLARLGETAKAEQQLVTARELGRDDWYEPDACVLLGRIDEALASFARGIDRTQTRWPGRLRYLKYDPIHEPLRRTARGAEILARGDGWLQEMLSGGSRSEGVAPALDGKSVAVLAFANLSDDKANEYFSDGISEELLNVLAKVPGLKVTARTSSFHFKGKDTAIKEIAQQLGVAYVVEGSVRKSGDKVRITAQLVKAADGFHVWSDTFTRDVKDIFAVQDEIAGLIALNLSLKLGARSPRAAVVVSPQAFELYVQARQAWSLRTTEGFARAEQLLNRALEFAPDFVRARAALIDVVQMRGLREGRFGSFGQRDFPELDRLLEQVRGVLAIEPDLAEAYATLGTTLASQWNRAAAERAYRRATELNPNYATGRHWFGMHLAEDGRMDEALAELKLASELDPMSFIILDNYGWLLCLAGRYSEGLRMLDRALALNPGFDQTIRFKATALVALGRVSEAAVLARQTRSLERELDVVLLSVVGLQAEAETLLGSLDARTITNRFQTLLAVGRREEALAALDDLSGVSKGHCIEVSYLPFFDSVRDDPRFIKYLATLGLTEAHARAQAWRKAHPPEKPEARK